MRERNTNRGEVAVAVAANYLMMVRVAVKMEAQNEKTNK